MKKIVTLVSTLAFVAIAASAFAANAVRISQVYGGGGSASSSASYKADYVELFNSSPSPVNVGGWVLAYGSAAGVIPTSGANTLTFPANTFIQPCQYFLVVMNSGTVGTGGANISGDINTGTLNMAAGAGKVMLFSGTPTNVTCGSEAPLVDKVGYGPTASCFEGAAPTAATANNSAAIRNNGGLTDTDQNGTDFTITTSPVPHTSASAANPNCSTVPARTSTWGAVKQIYR